MKDPEFAADYKVVSEEEDKRLSDLRRLEREVIDAALVMRRSAKNSYAMPTTEYRAVVDRFNSATDALESFEAEHN